MKKLYICGPMRGLPEHNLHAFFAAEKSLRDAGYDVFNPAQYGHIPTLSWAACLKRDITDMLQCDGLSLLDGWDTSAGAKLEVQIATTLGIMVLYTKIWLEREGQ